MDHSPFGAPDGEWLSISRARTRRPCEEQALVLKAMGVEHRVIEQPDGCHLLVPAADAPAALEQLRLYQRENPQRSSVTWPIHPASRGVAGALLYALALALAYVVQARYALGIDWTSAGALIAGPVQAGAWWRGVTALTLHADMAHVIGNMLFGGFFGYLAGQYLGSGIAWLAILATGTAGNVLNAWLQSAGHRSIGASTAVFAALGVVAACVWGTSRRFNLSWARRWAPAVGAIALLAYTGTGDENTDIVAHLAGFVAGGLGGLLLYRLPGIAGVQPRAQALAAALTVAVIALSWLRALSLS